MSARLFAHIEDTELKINEAENLGLGTVTFKLSQRLQVLRNAHAASLELESVLFSLP